jgi:hypothetical protein
VQYTAYNWLEKNRGRLSDELKALLSSSGNGLLQISIAEDSIIKKTSTVSAIFRGCVHSSPVPSRIQSGSSWFQSGPVGFQTGSSRVQLVPIRSTRGSNLFQSAPTQDPVGSSRVQFNTVGLLSPIGIQPV